MSERHGYSYCRNYCTGLHSRFCGRTAPLQFGYSPPNLLDRAKRFSRLFCNRIIRKVVTIFPWRHPGSFTGHRMWAWRESGNRCPPSNKACKKQTKEQNKNRICKISTSRAIINLESRSWIFFFWSPTWFIQLQNVNHSRLNLQIRFIVYLASNQQCRSRGDGHFQSDTRTEHTANFSSKPLFKKNMDSHSNSTHMLNTKCRRTFYLNLRSKQSLIEDSEAQHNRAELFGLKWSLRDLSVW
jgi:hypothetical protein